MPLVLPASVEAEEINREIEEQLEAEDSEARYWTAELKRIDPTVELRRASWQADSAELEPGQWYIRKPVPGTVEAYIPLPVGRPPGAWILEWLSAGDMWNPKVHRDRKEAGRKLREARHRAEVLRREQRQDHMREAVRAAQRIRDDRGMNHSSAAKRRGEGLK